jgi:hypothetical protein
VPAVVAAVAADNLPVFAHNLAAVVAVAVVARNHHKFYSVNAPTHHK